MWRKKTQIKKDPFLNGCKWIFYLTKIILNFSLKWKAFTNPLRKHPSSFKGWVKLRPSLILDLKCQLLNVQSCNWLSLFFLWHCEPIGSITWPLFAHLAKSSLSRFLWEWENRLHLNDCAKDSPPVWPREDYLFPLKSWASITSLSLINQVTVFLLATIFSSISLKIFCHHFENVVHMAFESFAQLLRF